MSGGSVTRIGVLTAGGDAPGLNAAIRAIVRSATGSYGWTVVGFEDGFEGLLEGRQRTLTLDDVRGILPSGGTILGTSNRCNPFMYTRPGALTEQPRDRGDEVVQRARELGLDALVVIGGDGTLWIGNELSRRGLPVVGVPKTIDNDVQGTEVTFGFDTAVTTATEAIDKLHSTAEAHHRVMIVEVMGRSAGWIALHAGIAGGADVILLPEIAFDLDHIARTIERRSTAGRRFTIIVVAEGARPIGGEARYEVVGTQWYARRYTGLGDWLRQQLVERVPQEVRSVVLGHLQRGGGPTARDRVLATALGAG
ncbi:MAG: 6-phosphofructokinase, partial [Thermomicrobiaceae bacterium]|nr:6-phosphofructokinase [Thermomicrobiaceae bacterium]